jgi:hypothetical protein
MHTLDDILLRGRARSASVCRGGTNGRGLWFTGDGWIAVRAPRRSP